MTNGVLECMKMKKTENSYSVYIHTFPNGKQYVGITMTEPARRWNGGSGYRKQPKIMNAIKKYGWENIHHEIVATGLSQKEAEEMEIRLIRDMNTIKNGYNVDNGGNASGTHTEETRTKISRGNKGKKKPPITEERRKMISEKNAGQGNPFYGKHHTAKTKEEHAEFMKGNDYFKGHHHTDEYKRAKSEQMAEKYKDGKNPRCKPVLRIGEDVKEYAGVRLAAREEGVKYSALFTAITKQRELNGFLWRYKNGQKELLPRKV